MIYILSHVCLCVSSMNETEKQGVVESSTESLMMNHKAKSFYISFNIIIYPAANLNVSQNIKKMVNGV